VVGCVGRAGGKIEIGLLLGMAPLLRMEVTNDRPNDNGNRMRLRKEVACRPECLKEVNMRRSTAVLSSPSLVLNVQPRLLPDPPFSFMLFKVPPQDAIKVEAHTN
jgi:hypothetical protein